MRLFVLLMWILLYNIWKYKMRILLVIAILIGGYFWFNPSTTEPSAQPAATAPQAKELGVVDSISAWLSEHTPKK